MSKEKVHLDSGAPMWYVWHWGAGCHFKFLHDAFSSYALHASRLWHTITGLIPSIRYQYSEMAT